MDVAAIDAETSDIVAAWYLLYKLRPLIRNSPNAISVLDGALHYLRRLIIAQIRNRQN